MWISVKDKMPEELTDVLLSDSENIGFGYWEYDSGMCTGDPCCPKGFDDDFIVLWHDEVNIIKTQIDGFPRVTHWMKLPDLP